MQIKLTGEKSANSKELIFSILDVFAQIGISLKGKSDRRMERMAEVCLAVGNIKKSFSEVCSYDSGIFLKTRDIISYLNKYYGENISSGSYDDIRRKDLVDLVETGVVINSSSIDLQATNNPTRGYALNPHFAKLLKSYNTSDWDKNLEIFCLENKILQDKLTTKRKLEQIPVLLPSGAKLLLSAGEHNKLQQLIIESFLPIYGLGAQVLYMGDTTDKFLYRADEQLKEIGFFTLEHEELPDVVAYSKNKNLLFLIETVHSAGPMSEVRVNKLKRQLKDCHENIIFVTAFLTKKTFANGQLILLGRQRCGLQIIQNT